MENSIQIDGRFFLIEDGVIPSDGMILIGDGDISQHWNENNMSQEGWNKVADNLEEIASQLRRGVFEFEQEATCPTDLQGSVR